jgi:hypothetical protein
VEDELITLKVQLAEEIMDVVVHKATLAAEFAADCAGQRKEVETAWGGLDDERRHRFEADLRRMDEDAAMVKRLSAALQGKHDDAGGGGDFDDPELALAAAHADALAMT